MKPNVTTNHIMPLWLLVLLYMTIHQECEYTNQTHVIVIVQFSILNCSVSYYRHSCIEHCFQMCPTVHCPNHTKMSTGLLLLSEVLQVSQD